MRSACCCGCRPTPYGSWQAARTDRNWDEYPVSLLTALARAKTEEDVKDAYIAALDLRDYFKGLVDIRTDKVWFEAKLAATAPLLMFAQLLVYVRAARLRGEPIPPFLAVIDHEKGAILPTRDALPALDDSTIVWPASGSVTDMQLAAAVAAHIGDRFTTYPIVSLGDEFCAAITTAIREGEIIRTPITPDNLRQVFDKWVDMIGSELDVSNQADYATLFFTDIMHDGHQSAYASVGANLVTQDGNPAFFLRGSTTLLPVTNLRAYRDFWSIYLRPPEERHRRWLLERRDSLLPLDEQRFKGAFYTPLHIVDKAYDQLLATLGTNWQDRYIVWDMCCGVGNLEVKHSNYRNVFMSTLDRQDIDIMRANRICVGAAMFQYDYLNDDVTDFGEIDYTLTNKVPAALQKAIADAKEGKPGAKPILVLINPPYGEAGSRTDKDIKTSISSTSVGAWMNGAGYGYAAKELFVQFMVRIDREIPQGMLAMFSTLKYVNSDNFEPFREKWRGEFLGGFITHSKAFDSLKGDFPIGFLIWDTSRSSEIASIETRVLDRAGDEIGLKVFQNLPKERFLSKYIVREKYKTHEVVPLVNAVTPTKRIETVRNIRWSRNAIAHFLCHGNDLQQAGTLTAILSSTHDIGFTGAYFVTEQNLWQVSIVFSVRLLIPHTWQNHNDQFLQPLQPPGDEFKTDCLVWMLFAGKNLTAGADGLRWDDRDWSLVNHFIPFTEGQVGARGRFESDFMVRYMAGMTFSAEAQAVLDAGRVLWSRYHAITFPRQIREELKLNRPDAGWYQVRRALKAYGGTELTDFTPFDAAYAALGAKLRPMVFELGFLPA